MPSYEHRIEIRYRNLRTMADKAVKLCLGGDILQGIGGDLPAKLQRLLVGALRYFLHRSSPNIEVTPQALIGQVIWDRRFFETLRFLVWDSVRRMSLPSGAGVDCRIHILKCLDGMCVEVAQAEDIARKLEAMHVPKMRAPGHGSGHAVKFSDKSWTWDSPKQRVETDGLCEWIVREFDDTQMDID